jgi:hypothetical protein
LRGLWYGLGGWEMEMRASSEFGHWRRCWQTGI